MNITEVTEIKSVRLLHFVHDLYSVTAEVGNLEQNEAQCDEQKLEKFQLFLSKEISAHSALS
jgi:hypothetical protein